MISDLKSRLEKERQDDATNDKASSLTRGLDGRIVMNIKDQAPQEKRRHLGTNPLRRKKKEQRQKVMEGGNNTYLGEVYSDFNPDNEPRESIGDEVDTRPRSSSRRPSGSSSRSRRSRSRESRRSEKRSRSRESRRSRRSSHVSHMR